MALIKPEHLFPKQLLCSVWSMWVTNDLGPIAFEAYAFQPCGPQHHVGPKPFEPKWGPKPPRSQHHVGPTPFGTVGSKAIWVPNPVGSKTMWVIWTQQHLGPNTIWTQPHLEHARIGMRLFCSAMNASLVSFSQLPPARIYCQ